MVLDQIPLRRLDGVLKEALSNWWGVCKVVFR